MKKCVICKKYYFGQGNDAQPISEGLCCNNCNKLVIAKQITMIVKGGINNAI